MKPHSPTYHRLLARIRRRYDTLTEPVTVADRAYAFTRVADPDRVLDDIAAAEDRLEKLSGRRREGDHLRLPYWAELWDSALAMGQWLVQENLSISRRILDLGCGMGFPGMVAASLGHQVLFADLEQPALLFAKLNSLAYDPPARTRQLNWEMANLNERFDWILGADILYARKQWEYLEPFWRAHLSEGGSVLLGEPGRLTGELFPAWITARGWSLKLHEQIIATRAKPLRLFELRPA